MNGRADAMSRTVDGGISPAPGGNSGIGPASTVAPSGQATGWPLGSYLELGALVSAVPSARLHARLVTDEWRLQDLADTVELIVSELVTNAVQASQELQGSHWQGRWTPGTPPVRLWLQFDRARVLVQVWDGNDRMPHKEVPGQDEENGRGLLIVEALCGKSGAYRLEEAGGKVVWGEVGGS
jgi:anti-sigma regulatory factor (Ser/Thr protein kinase)